MSMRFAGLLLLAVASVSMPVAVGAQETDSVVAPGRTVEIEYTMSGDDGQVVESNVGGEPLEYVHGQEQLFPRLEQALEGMGVGEEKSVTLEPQDAFGERNPDAVQEVPRDRVPDEAQEVGAELAIEGLDWPVRVAEVQGDSVVLDLNHPLAGEKLTFGVRILSIS